MTEDRVQRRGGVGEQCEVVRRGSDVLAEDGAHARRLALEPALVEIDRLALELALPFLVHVEYRPGHAPNAP